jgi:hypothetical protein
MPQTKKKEPSQRGRVQKVYIKKGVLLIIIPAKHYETITGIFHLCYKIENALYILYSAQKLCLMCK